MLIADNLNKLSLKEHNSEDFLTSSVFSVFKYSDPLLLKSYLELSIDLTGCKIDEISDSSSIPKYQFWPFMQPSNSKMGGTEPDLIIYWNNIAYIIEAKFHSGLSGIGYDEERIHDQLARQYQIGIDLLKNDSRVSSFKLIYLTNNPTIPKYELEQSHLTIQKQLDENANIYWLNWSKAFKVFRDTNLVQKGLRRDILSFLEKRNIGYFSGFQFENDIVLNYDTSQSLFFKSLVGSKRYWTFLKTSEFLMDKSKPIFYNKTS